MVVELPALRVRALLTDGTCDQLSASMQVRCTVSVLLCETDQVQRNCMSVRDFLDV
jgi:hypothetical protein